jgi:hypothetical protein
MTPAFTVILPHLRNPGNDRALAVCLDMLMANTHHEFALLMYAVQGGNLCETVNQMVEHAATDICVYHASDTFMAPNWDAPMLDAWDANAFVTGVLVEPGAIAMHPMNLHKDFGRKPDTFQRAKFEAWAVSEAPMLSGEGWPCPYMFSRSQWLAFGGLQSEGLQPDDHGFVSADTELWERWKAAGNRITRVRSYAYHLQRYSAVDEQEHQKRELQA